MNNNKTFKNPKDPHWNEKWKYYFLLIQFTKYFLGWFRKLKNRYK